MRALLLAALSICLSGCASGWSCRNRTMQFGTWTVTCRYVNGDRSCSGSPAGADFAFIMINHEQQHAREYALFVTDPHVLADGGGNALFQVLPASPDAAHPGLPTLSDYVSAGATKNGILTVALRKVDLDARSSADAFHLSYTRNGASSPSVDRVVHGVSAASAALERMNGCLDLPA